MGLASSASSLGSFNPSKAYYDSIRFQGMELPPDWGTEGVELFLMRKRLPLNNFHWGVFI